MCSSDRSIILLQVAYNLPLVRPARALGQPLTRRRLSDGQSLDKIRLAKLSHPTDLLKRFDLQHNLVDHLKCR